MISRLLLLLLFVAGQAFADERILDFKSDITVLDDGSMEVLETITVQAEGREIRRGIYRDFPTRYEDAFGNRYRVAFEPIAVRRDGLTENWFDERRSNGVRVYVGQQDVFLDPGVYVYEIRYRTDRQLGFFLDHDELYWNVTGHGWIFPIDAVSASVTLPAGAEVASVAGFTGRYGDTGQAYEASSLGNVATIRSTRVLGAREGLSIVVQWPKGVVTEPDWQQEFRYFFSDNALTFANGLALCGSLIWLLIVWSRVGRDPQAGVIFARYEPPADYSPASARYVSRMAYDPLTFSAAVINLAVKGHLEIEQSDRSDYVLKETPSDEPLAPGEAALKSRLFAKGPVLAVSDEHHATIGAARAAHKKSLRRDYLGDYFKKNSGYVLPSIGISLVVLIVGVISLPVTFLGIALFGVSAIVHGVFVFLLKAPTVRGRLLLDQLEGFKMYLEVAEQDDLEARHPPEKTPQLFERYLPFALALGVENEWAEQFSEVFSRLSDSGHPYQPVWYSGAFDPHRPATFAKNVGSTFSSAIASAATPPGSSSGGGGGGFSGGGGGGGGGGGW